MFLVSPLFRAVNSVLHRMGLKLMRNRPVSDQLALLLVKARDNGVTTILDIGANTGQTGRALRKAGWAGRIVSFEPMPSAHAALTAAAKGDARWEVMPPMALGSAHATLSMNVSRNSVSSSLLAVNNRSIDAAPETAINAQIEVPVAPLDDVFRPEWGDSLAMKIDTQGYEAEVLKGAHATLARTRIATIEISLVPLYEGTPSLSQVVTMMEQEGFRCIALTEGFADHKRHEVLQVDGVFVK